MQQKILILNGSGAAEHERIDDIRRRCQTLCAELKIELDFRQTENQHQLSQAIQSMDGTLTGAVINPGKGTTAEPIDPETYRSVLSRHALECPVIELALDNPFKPSEQVTPPVLAPDLCSGYIYGLGVEGYLLAIRSLTGIQSTAAQGSSGEAGFATIYVLNGPNLNLLGQREPHIYGHVTLDDIREPCEALGRAQGVEIDFRQTNHEGTLVDWIQEARQMADAILLNAAAYTHTSVAIHDALKTYDGIKVELHISNPHRREAFRHRSYVSSAVDALIAGLGYPAYQLLVESLVRRLQSRRS